MPEAPFGKCTRWLSVCTIDPARSSVGPADLIGALARSGIEARRVWKPMHLQPMFAGKPYYPHEPGRSFSDEVFARGVCLPSGSNMNAEAQGRIIRGVEQIFRRAHRQTVAAR
jgi:pyridoxal phosphate-dependent aminotransferase EpsN